MRVHRCSWIVLCLFLWTRLSLSSPWSATEGTCSSGIGTENAPGTAAQYIVRFGEYQKATYWQQALETVLGTDASQWTWVERHNAATSYPTDFGVLRFPTDVSEVMQERVRHLSFVKDVHPDRLLHRNLAYDSDGVEYSSAKIQKPPGRFRTRPTFGIDSEEDDYSYESAGQDKAELRKRQLLYSSHRSVTHMLHAEEIWKLGFSGQKIRVGVFDTGIRGDHPHVKNIKERTNWTHQNTLSDGLGHGSFVAGVIAGSNDACRGFAPDVELYTFKVFTDDQVSYTSWFLDAFNYAMLSKMQIVNLSIGGPDFLDHPFVEKVLEVTSSGIIMLSAIGNDGPLYGTLNNPADQNDVIGIGGINYEDHMARFSSRGMSTWELPLGHGRIKPDVLAYAQDVSGSKMQDGCRSLSGTSVASPVAAGAVALLASTVPENVRWKLLNPASMKQALVEGATRLGKEAIYVQGAGKINLVNSMQILQDYVPRASLIPSVLDLTDCPYMWPLCSQPLYANAVPVIVNATILNGMGVTGVLEGAPVFSPSNRGGNFISMDFEYSDVLWPWSGYLAIYIRVRSAGRNFSGIASGDIRFTVIAPPASGEDKERKSVVNVPFKAEIIPLPPREKRLLWDQFHSIKYPPGYFPRDNLDVQRDILDWHGDHPHTNFHDMFDHLRSEGYFLEILGSPYTCFNATQYGALMIVDSEDVFYPEEIAKLATDVKEEGLGVIVFAEWYNAETAADFRFFDDNTRSWWTPATGGSNIPGLNALLEEFGIAFGDVVLKGQQVIGGSHSVRYSSGANIVRLPAGSFVHGSNLEDMSKETSAHGFHYTLGLTTHGKGKLAVYGDSNCLDSSYQSDHCFGLLDAMLDFVNENEGNSLLESLVQGQKLQVALDTEDLPQPIENVNFTELSFVLSHPIQCYMNRPVVENIDAEEEEHHEDYSSEEQSDPGRRVTDVLGETTSDKQASLLGTEKYPSFLTILDVELRLHDAGCHLAVQDLQFRPSASLRVICHSDHDKTMVQRRFLGLDTSTDCVQVECPAGYSYDVWSL